MARVKYDVRGVESGQRQVLPAGVYNVKIVQADVTKPEGKDERIELIFEVINDSDHSGFKLYEYVNLESEAAKWKLRELLDAATVITSKSKEQGTLDTDKMLMGKVIGVKTMIRPADEQRGFDERAQVRRMFALDGDAATEEVEDFEEEEEDVEAEEELDLDSMDRSELKAFIKDEGLEIKVLKSMSDDDLRDAINQQLEVAEEEAEEEEDEEEVEEEVEDEAEEDEEPADDYDDWELSDLKEELQQRSLSDKGSQKTLIARLRKDDAEEDKPF